MNETWQEARSQHPLPSLCFSGRLEKQHGRPGLWLPRHFQLLWNCWKEFNETWQKARSQRPLPSLYFSGGSVNKKWPPWPIPQKNLKTWHVWITLIHWHWFYMYNNYVICANGIFYFFETDEQNSLKLDRKPDLNVLYQVCIFRVDWKTKMVVLFSDWPIHFWLLLWINLSSMKLDRKQDLNDLYQVCFYAPAINMAGAFSVTPFHHSVLLSFRPSGFSFRSLSKSYMEIFKWNLVHGFVTRIRRLSSTNWHFELKFGV